MLPKYSYEDLTVEDSLNRAKKKVMKNMLTHYQELTPTVFPKDPTSGNADKAINTIIDTLNNNVLTLNNMDTAVYFGAVGRRQDYKFMNERSYMEYMNMLNKLIFDLKNINRSFNKFNIYIGYVPIETVDRLRFIVEEYNNAFQNIYYEAFNTRGEFKIKQNNLKIDMDILNDKWADLIDIKAEFDNNVNFAFASYNEQKRNQKANAAQFIKSKNEDDIIPSKYI